MAAVESPFYRETLVREGRFAFKSLEPGSYTLTILDPTWGVTRRTIQVTPAFATPDGRVDVELDLEQTGESRTRQVTERGTVSVANLKVSGKARSAVRKAHVRFGRGDIHGGIALLERAVELAPTFVEAWNELGTIAYKAGQYRKAEEHFREALRHEPLAYAPMVNLGGTLLSQNRIDEALSFNLMACSMQPGDALANSQLGMNFFYKGQLHKALEYLLRAKEADPAHFSYPQMFLADIYGKLGRLSEARSELEEVLRLHPDGQVALLAKDGLRKLEAAGASF